MNNLFDDLPAALDDEVFEVLARDDHVTIERIVSRGQASPAGGGWYDQAHDEWILVLKGEARLAFERGDEVPLGPGDHLVIPAHRRHRVAWTTPDTETVWLAVHY
ncbi:cupin domain-containing protein [Halomonas nitroreducens]|uniref:Cupin domain-containing protein n=1 Tax=Halomonas nitroreducens TaxID=447425 RepID=A0A3S0KP05_9GAMM|nr:cupin domain-containing protein [Halomonas nitroreducens]RTQ99925.1 cupin domain-containing protein [Halomonas nitroreducens]